MRRNATLKRLETRLNPRKSTKSSIEEINSYNYIFSEALTQNAIGRRKRAEGETEKGRVRMYGFERRNGDSSSLRKEREKSSKGRENVRKERGKMEKEKKIRRRIDEPHHAAAPSLSKQKVQPHEKRRAQNSSHCDAKLALQQRPAHTCGCTRKMHMQ